jgi:poly-gamma-glutamate capsule biosynthesis protein CapA/YwtB (metallophosphatase superfamily)
LKHLPFERHTLNACAVLRRALRVCRTCAFVAAASACSSPAAAPARSFERSAAEDASSSAQRQATLPPSATAVSVPATAESDAVLIVAGGDVSFGREVGQRVVENPVYAPFAGILPFFRDADVRFVNLESQLSEQQGETQSPRHRLIFTGPPEAARTLARAGIHVVSTANNHAWDYGRSALFETLEHLRAAGIQSAGTGRDPEQAYRPAILRSKGLSVALFALTHVWNQGPIDKHEGRDYVAWATFAKLREALAKARAENDIVLVSYHGGAEYQDAPSPQTRGFVRAVIEAGADAVIGHHPHVIQGIGWFSGRPVFYSLGNLVFGSRGEHPWTRYGMLARMRVSAGAPPSFGICPYRIDDFVPVVLSTSPSDPERIRFLAHLRSASTAVGGVELGESDELGCVSVAPLAKSSVPDPLRAGRAARSLASR